MVSLATVSFFLFLLLYLHVLVWPLSSFSYEKTTAKFDTGLGYTVAPVYSEQLKSEQILHVLYSHCMTCDSSLAEKINRARNITPLVGTLNRKAKPGFDS